MDDIILHLTINAMLFLVLAHVGLPMFSDILQTKKEIKKVEKETSENNQKRKRRHNKK
jgi:hypothetical protein